MKSTSTDVTDAAKLAIFVHGVSKVQSQQQCPISNVCMWGRWSTDVIGTAQLAIFVCGFDKYRCQWHCSISYLCTWGQQITDVSNIAQSVIFMCGVDKDFNITEELPASVLFKHTTRVSNFLTSVTGNSDKVGMNLTNLSGVTINGASAVVGRG